MSVAGQPAARPLRPRRVVLDTNVLVSALPSPQGTAAQIFPHLLSGALRTLYDARMLAEYREVVTRPHLGIEESDAARVVGRVIRTGTYVDADPIPMPLPDVDDLPFAEVAVTGRADALVTGNARHFAPLQALVRVLSPRALLTELQDQK